MTTRRRSSSTRQPGDQDSFGFHDFGWFLLISMVFHGPPDKQGINIVLVFMVFCYFFVKTPFTCSRNWLVFKFSWSTRQPDNKMVLVSSSVVGREFF